MDLKVLFPSKWQIVSPIVDAQLQLSSFESFLNDCEKDGSYAGCLAGLLAMMERHSEHGHTIFNAKQCHYVSQDEKIYQYIKGPLRLLWFEAKGRIIVCVHAYKKKSQKTPKDIINEAIRVKKKYLEADAAGRINLIKEED